MNLVLTLYQSVYTKMVTHQSKLLSQPIKSQLNIRLPSQSVQRPHNFLRDKCFRHSHSRKGQLRVSKHNSIDYKCSFKGFLCVEISQANKSKPTGKPRNLKTNSLQIQLVSYVKKKHSELNFVVVLSCRGYRRAKTR